MIGLPGETVEVREKKVYINGTPLDEPYVHFLEPPATPSELHEVTSFDVRERYGPVTVPPDQYFMMGDNRDNSQDSRYWGFLPRDYIKGKALVIYWSYEAEPRGLRGRGRRRDDQGPGVGVRALLHADPLGPDVAPDALIVNGAREAGDRGADRQRDVAHVRPPSLPTTSSRTACSMRRCTVRRHLGRSCVRGSSSLAAQFELPVTQGDVMVTRNAERRTLVDIAYVRPVELAPGFTYPLPLTDPRRHVRQGKSTVRANRETARPPPSATRAPPALTAARFPPPPSSHNRHRKRRRC